MTVKCRSNVQQLHPEEGIDHNEDIRTIVGRSTRDTIRPTKFYDRVKKMCRRTTTVLRTALSVATKEDSRSGRGHVQWRRTCRRRETFLNRHDAFDSRALWNNGLRRKPSRSAARIRTMRSNGRVWGNRERGVREITAKSKYRLKKNSSTRQLFSNGEV